MNRAMLRRRALMAMALGVLVVAAASAGCYRRVVGARGLGTSGVDVRESESPTLIDRLLGSEPEPARTGPRMRVN